MPADRSRTDYEVLSRHADANGRLSVRALVAMLLDAADVHAAQWSVSLGQLADGERTWVLSRLHVRLDRQPGWDEPISIETWPTGAIRVLAGRDFRIEVGRDVIGAASTLWLMIDRTTRKPVPLPDFIKKFEAPAGSPVVRARGKWPSPAECERTALTRRTVRWIDLDLNQHATSPAYLEWLLGPLPAEVPGHNRLAELDILFKGEALLDDEVAITIAELPGEDLAGPEREFTHAVKRIGDDTLLATARSKWTP